MRVATGTSKSYSTILTVIAASLAARIVLAPLVEDADAWQALRLIMLGNLDPNALDDLKLSNVLEKEVGAPSFGHATRRDVARSFLDTRRPEAVRAEGEYLILALAQSVNMIDISAAHYIETLYGLRDTVRQYNLGSLPLALCEAAGTFLEDDPSSIISLIEGVQQACRSREAGFGFILATGLFNLLHHAMVEGDLTRRDALVDELRVLARTFPDDAAVHDRLARSLVSVLYNARAQDDLNRRDALLDELRALARTHPEGRRRV